MRIALGLDLYLEEFAAVHDAQTFRDWGDGDQWQRNLQRIASSPNTEILFDLTDVDVFGGLLRASSGRGGGTDWELSQFKGNTMWLERSTWFRDGMQVEQPEELT